MGLVVVTDSEKLANAVVAGLSEYNPMVKFWTQKRTDKLFNVCAEHFQTMEVLDHLRAVGDGFILGYKAK